MAELKSVDGQEVNPSYAALAMIMIEKDIKSIDIRYCGSGDSGEYDAPCYTFNESKKVDLNSDTKEFMRDVCYKVIDDFINPDFNNEGCNGDISFFIQDGELKFDAYHTVMIPNEQFFSSSLVDTNML